MNRTVDETWQNYFTFHKTFKIYAIQISQVLLVTCNMCPREVDWLLGWLLVRKRTGDGGPFPRDKACKGVVECAPRPRLCVTHIVGPSHRIDVFSSFALSAHEQLCISYVVSGPLNAAIFLCLPLLPSLSLSRATQKELLSWKAITLKEREKKIPLTSTFC